MPSSQSTQTFSRALGYFSLGLGVAAAVLAGWRVSKQPPASRGHTTPPTPDDRHVALTVRGAPETLRQRWYDHARASDVSAYIVGARFVAAPAGRGTEIHLTLREDSSGPLAAAGAKLATLSGRAPKQKAMDALRRFKQVVETGHVAHSEATIHGHPHPGRPPERVPSAHQQPGSPASRRPGVSITQRSAA